MTARLTIAKRYGAGFTLVELLVGLSLLAMILVMVFSGLYTTSRSWAAGDHQAGVNDDYRLAVAFIRRQINQTAPFYYLSRDNNQVIFQGRSDSLYFAARLPAHRGGPDMYLAAFRMAEEADSLEFSYQPLHPDVEMFNFDSEQVKHQSLMDSVDSIELAYYGRESPEDEQQWHDRWEEQDRLPELVRFRIFRDERSLPEEDLYIRIPAKVERGQPQMVLVGTETS